MPCTIQCVVVYLLLAVVVLLVLQEAVEMVGGKRSVGVTGKDVVVHEETLMVVAWVGGAVVLMEFGVEEHAMCPLL